MVKKDDFVNHHMHSFFSSLDGMPSPEDIMQRIISLGQTSFSITDHGSLSAIPRAYQAAQKAGVSFTPGIEAYYTHDRFNKSRDRFNKDYYHMILLAYNNEGYHNLLKMQTTSWEDGLKGKYPRIDHEVLEKYHKGITVTTSCLGGLIPQLLLRGKTHEAMEELSTLVDIFGKDNVYIEVQNHHQNDDKLVLPELLKMHQDTGVKLLATSDSHYCLPEDYEAHDALLCTGTKKKKNDHGRFKFVNDEFYIPPRDRMEEILPPADFPGALDNTVELAEKTDFKLKINDDMEYLMPHIDTIPGMTEQETLRERVMIGAKDPKRYGDMDGNIPDEVQDRIDYELEVIENMGFGGYFIIVSDMIQDFADNGIYAGPGRGCLHGDTLIVTPYGNKKISELTLHDKVMTSNGNWSHIKEVISHETAEDEKILKIALKNGNVIRLTPKHKVLVKKPDEKDPQWVKAINITQDDSFTYVMGEEISYVDVSYIDTEDAPQYVYDITVKDGDPSFLTEAGTVHNSAPGSVVVYCMGITDVDPFEHGLFFERFLNPDRISMPDIDVDVPKSKRHKCLQLMEDKYGKGHVAHLANYTTMGTKDALNRISKVYEVTTKFTEIVIEYCDSTGITIQELAKNDLPSEITTKKELLSYDDDILKTIVEVSSKLEGTLASYGVHASGIVVTNTPIDDNFPIRISKTADLPVSQYDGVDVEKLGGVKIDILGLINLDQCEDAERNIKMDLGVDVDSNSVPKDDKKVYEMLSKGEGGGVFQLGCLAGDTIVDGMRLDEIYLRRNSEGRKKTIRSVFLGEGVVKENIVDKIVYSGKKQLFLMTTLSGNSIRATKDHKFFTPQGWKKLEELRQGDQVVIVDTSIGMEDNVALSIRDKQDVAHYYHHMNPDLIPVDYNIDSPFTTFTADFRRKYPDYNSYVKLVPSNGIQGGKDIEKKVNDDASNLSLQVVSYEEVMETYYKTVDNACSSVLLPEGTSWDTIQSITLDNIEDTYDIMMRAPVHNFIANSFMVHNSSGMQSLMRVLQPQEFKDLSALIALYRPGPMGMDTHNEYARRKNQGAEQSVLHPEMEKILKDNYNLIVYQEDIMALSRLLAGYTGGESDTLRKAMAKKNPAMMKQQEEKFIPAVNDKYGGDLGNKLWEVIKPFGAYAFNKSHSVAYGFTTYRTAWLKTHYPAQFGGAVIDNILDKPDKLLEEILWMKRFGLKIYTPCINNSQIRSVTTKNSIQLPIHLIKGIGYDVAQRIIQERDENGKYTSVVDFCYRNNINERTLISIAKSGGFDSLGASRASIIYNKDSIISESKKQSSKSVMTEGLFGDLYDNDDIDDSKWTSPENEPDYMVEDGKVFNIDIALYALWEKESMGVLIGPHPFEIIKEYILGNKLLGKYPAITEFKRPTRDMEAIGYMTDVSSRFYVKNGAKKPLTKFNIETDQGIVPGVVFDKLDDPDKYENQFVYIRGNLTQDGMSDSTAGFHPNILADKISPIKMENIYKGGKV